MAAYGKSYASTVEEEQRFLIFKDNVNFAHETNAAGHTFRLGVTEWADQTADEFGQTHFGVRVPDKQWGDLPNLGMHDYKGEPLADSVDWNAAGAVTPVKNQGQCGSCWSFSTTGSLEGAWEIATKKLVSISEQQFVDCDKVDSGCSGGLMDSAFKYAEANALCTEESYPYKAKNGICQAKKCTTGIPAGGVTGFKDVSPDEWQECLRRPELYRGDGYDYENEIRMMAEGKGDVGMYDKKDKDYYATIASSMAPLSALSVGVLAAMASF